MDKNVLTFEQMLAELSDIVKKLDSGKLDLEVAMKLYERGVELSKLMNADLAKKEARVEVLTQEETKR